MKEYSSKLDLIQALNVLDSAEVVDEDTYNGILNNIEEGDFE